MTVYQVVGILWSLALLFVYLSGGAGPGVSTGSSAGWRPPRSDPSRSRGCGRGRSPGLVRRDRRRDAPAGVARSQPRGESGRRHRRPRGSGSLTIEESRARRQLASRSNSTAWRLATDPDPSRRDPAKAVELAEQAASAEPDNSLYLITRGVARYRAGDFTAAIGDLERGIKLLDSTPTTASSWRWPTPAWETPIRPGNGTGSRTNGCTTVDRWTARRSDSGRKRRRCWKSRPITRRSAAESG